jgi:translocation and assembly module TamA
MALSTGINSIYRAKKDRRPFVGRAITGRLMLPQLSIRRVYFLALYCLLLFAVPSSAFGDEVKYEVRGLEDPMLTNVVNHVSSFRLGGSARLNRRLQRKIIEDTRVAAAKALRPYGYFQPVIDVALTAIETGQWRVTVDVTAGEPVTVGALDIRLSGPGSELGYLQTWLQEFPLAKGKRLNQPAWDRAKQDALDLLETTGYLNATFLKHEILVDTEANSANLHLHLDTGEQAVMGRVVFQQSILDETVLTSLQRFRTGDAYSAWLLEKFRLDLWRSGYFEDIRVIERRNLVANPPSVDLEVELQPRKRNTWQGTFGYGTDTLARLQVVWGRHLVSSRGDNFDIGLGWQQKDNEFTFQSNYRLPRKTDTKQFWIASFGLKSENYTLDVSSQDLAGNRFKLADGKFTDYSLRFGKTRARNLDNGMKQMFETPFVQYVHETADFNLVDDVLLTGAGTETDDMLENVLQQSNSSVALGMEWAWPEIRGNGFRTTGHHERAWLLTSNKAWGSDLNFSQIYLSSRVNLLAGERWKFLFRAEAGYSDADTSEFAFDAGQGTVSLPLTDLPYFYRFKAGGSRSVRGYAFERLGNDGLGARHVLTASAEVEYLLFKEWSVAMFADIGNAFDDWSKPSLKFGSGVGVRWYSVIGALRLDFAKAWDLEGEPWRIHLTIGTPLL